MKIHPPRWADRFLEWYCNPALLEQIQGDAYELFFRQAKENKRKADLLFAWNVIRFFRWKNMKKSESTYSSQYTFMFKSYLMTALRSTLRNRTTSLINLLGLSLGVGVAITVFLFMDFMFHIDGFHIHCNRIYQITSHVQHDRETDLWGNSPWLLGPALEADQPSIESVVRVDMSDGAVRRNDVVFNEAIWFVDPDFLRIFSFPVVRGNPNALDHKTSLVLTVPIAEKYFGTADPIGQTLSIKFSNGSKEEFNVGAVIQRPENSGMYPTVLLAMEKSEDIKSQKNYDWSDQTDATFVMFKPGHPYSEIEGAMSKYLSLQNKSSTEWRIADFEFIPLPRLAQRSYEIHSAISFGGHPSGVWSLTTIAVMLLLLACFNYMNVSVATVATRLKEIGIRKVIGSRKKDIVQQFLTENFMLCFFSLVLGGLVSYLLFLPGLNTLYPFTVPFSFHSGNTAFLVFVGLLIFVGLVSGSYPSVYVSSFQPIRILRGREKFGQRGLFSRILLMVQFILAFTTIVGSFVFIDNSLYQKYKDWGYDHSQNMVVPVRSKEQFLALRDKAINFRSVEQVSGSVNHIGYQNTKVFFDHLQYRFQTILYPVGFGYTETMNLRLKAGRSFDKRIQSDYRESVLVNESFVEKMGWKEPLNQSFDYDSVKRYVIGVVRDFHYDGFYDPIGPALFTIGSEDHFRYLSVKVAKGTLAETETFLKGAWKEIAPDDPYEGIPQDRAFENFQRDNNANVKLLSFISFMAVGLACLGLFGLVSYNITRRLKEFSIRKVFGASLIQIFRLMNRDYAWILVSSFLIGAPAGFLLVNSLIQHIYPDPQPARALPFVIAIGLMMVTVVITVGSQMRRVAEENPSMTLKNE